MPRSSHVYLTKQGFFDEKGIWLAFENPDSLYIWHTLKNTRGWEGQQVCIANPVQELFFDGDGSHGKSISKADGSDVTPTSRARRAV